MGPQFPVAHNDSQWMGIAFMRQSAIKEVLIDASINSPTYISGRKWIAFFVIVNIRRMFATEIEESRGCV